MIEPEIAFANLAENAALAEMLLKHTFAALLNGRWEDLPSSTSGSRRGWSRNSRGSSAPLGVSAYGYGEAIQVLERANKKFEFPVNRRIDLQSEHERYLTEKYAKKRGIERAQRGP